MRKYSSVWASALCLTVLLGSCRQDSVAPDTLKMAEVDKAFEASLNFRADVEHEITTIGDDANQPRSIETLRAAIKLERTGNKIVGKLNEVGDDKTVQLFVQLRRSAQPNESYVATIQAKAKGEKQIELREKSASFQRLGTATALNSQQTDGWQIRLIVGGSLNVQAQKVDFSDVKQLVIASEQGNVDLSSYTGKVPYVSNWTNVQATLSNGKLSFSSPTGGAGNKSFVPLQLKPYGNILRVRVDNKHTSPITVSELKFKSNDVSSQGSLELGQTDFVWTPSATTQETRTSFNRTLATNAGFSAFLWVAPTTGNLSAPSTTLTLSFSSSNGITTSNISDLQIFSKNTRGNVPQAKSTPISIEVRRQLGVQPITRMAPNYLVGKGNATKSFATSLSASGKAQGVGDYYSLTEANQLSSAGSINIGGQNWHMATQDDYVGVFPYGLNGQDLFSLANAKVYEQTETVDLGAGSKTYKSLYYRADKNSPNTPLYALRFLDSNGNTTPYTAAFRYELKGVWNTGRTGEELGHTDVVVRPIGSWGSGEILTGNHLKNTIATENYWNNNRNNDINRQLSARGEKTSNRLVQNGSLLKAWVAPVPQLATQLANKSYVVLPDKGYHFANPQRGTIAPHIPILLFKDR